jgi:hypothetical protein
VEAPDEVKVVAPRVHDKPELGETALLRVTVPVNPGAKLIVMVEVPAEPATPVTLVGLAVMLKAVPTL